MARGRQQQIAQTSPLANQMRIEKAKQDIENYRAQLHLNDPRGYEGHVGLYHRTIWMGALAEAYKTIGDLKRMQWACRELIQYAEQHSNEIPNMKDKLAHGVASHFKNAHFLLAPYSFHAYLVAMEWNFSPENKFYADRYSVMQNWAHEMERLEYGDYDILGLSAPPRSGKTGIGTLFLTWLMGRHPDKSMTFNTHTTRMSRKEYSDVISLLTDPRREWGRIFPGLQVSSNAEDLWIDLTPKNSPNNYKSLYCTAIDAQKAGVMEASWLIYCDDLIGGIEEALNPTRLETAWDKYSTDILQRKNGNVKILHIATRWSLHDPLSRVEAMNEGNPRAKFICVPGLDESGKSNFNFPYHPLDEKHFDILRESMDDISFSCIVMQHPIERDGLVFTKDSLSFYEGILPDGEPDEIVFAGDIAFGGGDFLCVPVAYVYGYDAYIHDVIHTDKGKETTKLMVVNCIIENRVQRGYIEANNGGSDYAADIDERLRLMGHRCHIESRNAPSNKAKLTRILDAQAEIKALITDGSGYNLHFLSAKAAKGKPMYQLYLKHLMNFNQSAKYIGKQKDDAADATSMLVNEVLNRKNISGKVTFMSRKALAI